MAGETKAGFVEAKARNKANTQWRLKLQGTWYGVDKSANVDGVDQGAYVEYQLGGFTSRTNGAWVPTVARIRPSQAPAGATPSLPTGGGVNRLKSAAWDDSAMRFISNVVGCAIDSGKCESPVQVSDWALAAQDALLILTGERIQGPTQAPETSATQESDGDSDGWDDLAPASGRQPAPPSDW